MKHYFTAAVFLCFSASLFCMSSKQYDWYAKELKPLLDRVVVCEKRQQELREKIEKNQEMRSALAQAYKEGIFPGFVHDLESKEYRLQRLERNKNSFYYFHRRGHFPRLIVECCKSNFLKEKSKLLYLVEESEQELAKAKKIFGDVQQEHQEEQEALFKELDYVQEEHDLAFNAYRNKTSELHERRDGLPERSS